MDLQTVTAFFGWCTIINGGILVLWAAISVFARDFMYGVHSKWFSIPRETFDAVIYSFLGVFKIVFVAFNLVPYVALVLVA